MRQYSLAGSLVLLFVLACDRRQPVEPSSVEAASTATGPKLYPPSNTNAVAISESRIDVSWQDNSTNETGFEVQRSTAGASGPFELRASTGAGVTRYSDVGLAPLTQYCYKVRAFKKADGKTSYSDFSNTACATTAAPPPPNAPSATNAVPSNSSTVDVTWTDNSANEDGFRVERSLDGGASWTTASTTAPNLTSLLDGGRSSEQQVCYRVIAVNAGGDSPSSNTDCTTPPAVPTGLTATGLDGPAIDLAWTDHSAVEDGYEVLRAPDGVTFMAVADLPANSTSYRDAGLGPNTTYWYEVRAKKDGGRSDLSNIVSTTAGSCVPTSAAEICGNGLDDDCNGLIDAADPACAGFGCQDCSVDQCPPGYACGPDLCCFSTCSDGVRDGDESDVDCGGSCAKCAAGLHCVGSWDCASNSCVNGICQP